RLKTELTVAFSGDEREEEGCVATVALKVFVREKIEE
ncbi:hypothetical protein A2U01_0102755, partial [Trifolium medium]|nr:hypothetical protein [Trifolium medium]